MNPNTWYYTLSTISQTLAAILGLAAVLVVLRLQGLIKNISDYRERALDILIKRKKYIKPYIIPENISLKMILYDLDEASEKIKIYSDGNPDFVRELTQLSLDYEPNKKLDYQKFIWDTQVKLNMFVSQRDDVVRLIAWPAIFIFVAIALSIILLGITDFVINNSLKFLMPFDILLAVFGIWSIIRACWKILFALKTLE